MSLLKEVSRETAKPLANNDLIGITIKVFLAFPAEMCYCGFANEVLFGFILLVSGFYRTSRRIFPSSVIRFHNGERMKVMKSWTVPAAFWSAQALQGDSFSRPHKWEQARRTMLTLPPAPPEGPEADHMLVEALAFLAEVSMPATSHQRTIS
jgi:hypothetical protein